MKIGWKPRYSDTRSAGARIRCFAPINELRKRGYDAEVFQPKNIERYSLVVFSKSYDENSQNEILKLKARNAKVVFDLFDNHFYNPNALPELERAKDQIRRVMALSDALVASTDAMADVMREERGVPSRPIVVIGDSVEADSANAKKRFGIDWFASRNARRVVTELREDKKTGITPLTWFGIHGGQNADYGMGDLLRVKQVLEEIGSEYPISLTVISNSKQKYRDLVAPWKIQTRYVEWNPHTFCDVLKEHEIAVIPVTINPFTRCKSPNRILQALHLGLAVVADIVPSYQEFLTVAAIGDWNNGLRMYLTDIQKRRAHVEAARRLIADRWTVAKVTDQWEALFNDLVAGDAENGQPGSLSNRLSGRPS